MDTASRDAIVDYLVKNRGTEVQRQLAQLRLDFSDIGTLRSTFIASIREKERIYPTILPIQASGRWSYLNPPLSGFPKKCINPDCPQDHHEWVEDCWSLADCLLPDAGTFWIEHDLDAVEHRIFSLLLQWKERLYELLSGVDIHTPVTCTLFNLPYPPDKNNPHGLCTCSTDRRLLQEICVHCDWRRVVKWQGKNDTRRTMSKNFTYGQGQYCYVRLARKNEKVRKPYRNYKGLIYTPTVVYLIPNIESYRIMNSKTGELERPDYEQLAINFMETEEQVEIQKRKAVLMEKCRKDKYSRTLYGGKRYGWISSQDAAKELFNHIIQGTVASYINESAILLQKHFPDSYLIHNKHDALKWAFQYHSNNRQEEEQEVLEKVKKICQRELSYGKYSIPITATFSIKRAYGVS